MKNYTVKLYDAQDYGLWNAFVRKAKNATFLFERDFMEYHSDRFEDYSLVVLDGAQPVALLPANRSGSAVHSHQGLTYGGLVILANTKVADVLAIFYHVLKFLHQHQIQSLHLKMIPPMYCDFWSDELAYALFLADASLVRRDCLSVLDLQKPFALTKSRKQGVRRGVQSGLQVREESNFSLFWNEILIPNMRQKHNVAPVHTVGEIEKLHRLFPDNIRHFNVFQNDEIVGGTTVFVTRNVVHPQYISAQSQKNELGTLDFLYHHLIADVFKDAAYFDFGISNESDGRQLNEGLIFWKESFGTATIVQDFYQIDTARFGLLENVLI